MLRQTEHGDIRSKLNTCRNDLQRIQVPARTRDCKIPDALVRSTLKVKSNDDGDTSPDLDDRNHDGPPKEEAFGF